MRIAHVEDDGIQRRPIGAWLTDAGHSCVGFGTCGAFLQELHSGKDYDLLLLDWEMPDLSGIDLMHKLRGDLNYFLPIIFLTIRDTEEDIVVALQGGADDYLTKPPRRRELLARIEVAFRRCGKSSVRLPQLQVGPFELDTKSQQLSKNGCQIELTLKEFVLAYYMLSNLGKIITRRELLKNVWGLAENSSTRTIDTHISRLRKKLGLILKHGWQLTSVYRYGYRLERMENEPS